MRRIAVIAPVMVGLLAAGGAQAMAAPAVHTIAVPSHDSFGPLADLAVQRLLVSDQVAAAKFGTDKPIDDPAREQQVLADARTRAVALGIDPDATAKFFQGQIDASKTVQRGLFARWTEHPEQAPTTRPDLTVIRGQLDQLTTELLQQLVATNDIRQPTARCGIQLFRAELVSELRTHLDQLHRDALRVALAPVC